MHKKKKIHAQKLPLEVNPQDQFNTYNLIASPALPPSEYVRHLTVFSQKGLGKRPQTFFNFWICLNFDNNKTIIERYVLLANNDTF